MRIAVWRWWQRLSHTQQRGGLSGHKLWLSGGGGNAGGGGGWGGGGGRWIPLGQANHA